MKPTARVRVSFEYDVELGGFTDDESLAASREHWEHQLGNHGLLENFTVERVTDKGRHS